MGIFDCCIDCQDRKLGYRSDCQKWAAACAKHEAIKAEKAKEHMVSDYIGGNAWRRKW